MSYKLLLLGKDLFPLFQNHFSTVIFFIYFQFINNYLVISARDLEIWVCGKKTIDLQLLKKNTIYTKGLNSNSANVQAMWAALEKMREEDKVKFIRFCWA